MAVCAEALEKKSNWPELGSIPDVLIRPWEIRGLEQRARQHQQTLSSQVKLQKRKMLKEKT